MNPASSTARIVSSIQPSKGRMPAATAGGGGIAPARAVAAAQRPNDAVVWERLLQASAAGDRQAFKCLYEQTSARLFRAVRRAVWSHGEAEEVLQEVFVKIWRHAGSFDPGKAQALTWMLRIAHNGAIDHLRRQAPRRQHEAGDPAFIDDGGPDLTAVDPAANPEECLQQAEEERRVDQLLEMLGARPRQVLVLAFRDGLTQPEIAERLGAPLGTVKSWMRRALQQLKLATERQRSA